MLRPICGDCGPCLARTRRLLGTKAPTPLLPGVPPTAAQLERHAQRYGPEAVAETAAEYGISVAISRPRAARKAGGPSLKTRVAGYVADGYGVDVIAELEDLSPARARRIVQEVS